MTTAVTRDYPDVIEADEDELRIAVENTLVRLGMSFSELEAQARKHQFTSVKARMAWVTIGDLGRLAPGR